MAITKASGESSLSPNPTNPIAENVLPQQPISTVDINNTYFKVPGSNFGYLDKQDGGMGAWMDKTNNKNVIGASIPISHVKAIFGNTKAAKNRLLEIHNPASGKTLIAPLVDLGPGEGIKYGIDLTYGCYTALGGALFERGGHVVGGKGLYDTFYRLLTPQEEAQYGNLRKGYAGGAHLIGAPTRPLTNCIDLMEGVNSTRAEAIAKTAKGQVPDYPATVENTAQGSQGAAGAESSVIHTPTDITPSPTSTSGMPKGVFSLPEVGSMLYVFFRGGDPMFPVYFAASYGATEWAAAYSGSSPPLYYPGTDPTKTSKSDGAFMVPNKGGGLQCIESVDGPAGNNRSIKMFGYSGAHLEFGEEHNVYYSPRDDYHHADGNKFDIANSNREVYTKGDHNHVTVGDQFIKIGNITKAAMAAHDEIHSAVNSINDKMAGK